MKRLIAAILLALAAAFAAGAAEISLTGEWQVHRIAAGYESTQTCTFTQKEGELTGNCKSETGTVNINGKVEGKKVTWTYKTEREGSPLTVDHKGMIESADRITGTLIAVEYGVEGEFTATRVK